LHRFTKDPLATSEAVIQADMTICSEAKHNTDKISYKMKIQITVLE